MPSMPPFARRDKVADYVGSERCAGPGERGKFGVGWREERIRSGDGVEVAVLVGGVEREGRDDVEGDGDGMREGKGEQVREKGRRRRRNIVVVYFQGYVYAFTDNELLLILGY